MEISQVELHVAILDDGSPDAEPQQQRETG